MTQTNTIVLPPPNPDRPLLTRLVSDPLFPSESTAPIVWIVGGPHPLVPNAKVVRMFFDVEGVEIYSHDGKSGIRNLVPMNTVKLIEEAMSLDMFVDELALAEEEDDGGDEDLEEPEPELDEPPPASPANGQVAPS